MTLEAAVKAILIGDAGVAALVGAQVWTGRLPGDDVTYPAVTVMPVSLQPEMAHDGPVDFAEQRVQIDAYASEYAGVRALADAVRLALNGYKGTAAGETLFGMFFDNEVPEWGDSLGIWRITQDYRVTWRIGV